MTFEEFKLDSKLLEAISYMNFEKATPIQEKAIPLILEGKDLIACAQTGTGKSAAFILPILHKLAHRKEKSCNTLIIVPTRELAIQIEQQIQGFSYFVSVNSIAIYGGGDGADFVTQKLALVEGTDIIVATPGKLISHLNMGYVKFDKIEHLILDEADRMLDMGFYEDIQSIISYIPSKRQTLMFSATMPPKIREMVKKTLYKPVEINIALSKPAAGVKQLAYMAYNNQKIPLLAQLISEKPEYKSIIVFSSTKRNVSEIVNDLRRKKFQVAGISSDLEQHQREAVLSDFRTKKVRIIVATDVLSRGIDIKDINLVVNFDVPGDAEDYVHRIGRTARAETKGVAITFINDFDIPKFNKIEELIQTTIEKPELPINLGETPKYGLQKERPRFKKKQPFKRKNYSKNSKPRPNR